MILGARYPDQEVGRGTRAVDGVRRTWRENCQQGSQADCMRNFLFSDHPIKHGNKSIRRGVRCPIQ